MKQPNLIDVVYQGQVIGLATTHKGANEIIRRHAKQNQMEIPLEASLFLASVFQRAAITGDRKTVKDCLSQMKILYQDEQSNSDNSTKGGK